MNLDYVEHDQDIEDIINDNEIEDFINENEDIVNENEDVPINPAVEKRNSIVRLLR